MKFRVDFSSGESTVLKAFSSAHAIRRAILEMKPRDSKARTTPVCDSCEKEFSLSEGTFEVRRSIGSPVGLAAAKFRRRTCSELACAMKALEKLHEETNPLTLVAFPSIASRPPGASFFDHTLKVPITTNGAPAFSTDVFAGRFPCDFPQCKEKKIGFRSYADLKNPNSWKVT
jgi:hypothetical protein